MKNKFLKFYSCCIFILLLLPVFAFAEMESSVSEKIPYASKFDDASLMQFIKKYGIEVSKKMFCLFNQIDGTTILQVYLAANCSELTDFVVSDLFDYLEYFYKVVLIAFFSF